MNFMNFKVGDECYVPFWILLDFVDATPPDPFIKCMIISLYEGTAHSPSGDITATFCDLNLGKDDLIASAMPVDYLIAQQDLKQWAENISKWFADYQG